MNTDAFKAAYNESRNGVYQYHFNPLYRRFHYSNGVRDCAQAGCYWLLDALGTELPAIFKKGPRAPSLLVVTVSVPLNGQSRATIVGKFSDESDPPEYSTEILYTDMPGGDWVFFVSDDGDGVLRCILPTEY